MSRVLGDYYYKELAVFEFMIIVFFIYAGDLKTGTFAKLLATGVLEFHMNIDGKEHVNPYCSVSFHARHTF